MDGASAKQYTEAPSGCARAAALRVDGEVTAVADNAPSRPRPLRADAARNRDKVLAAATAVFADSGTEASLEEVARRAGVGIGTLYRHFPTRGALIEHVYRENVERLCTAVPELLGRLPADQAIEEWVLSFAEYAGRKRDTVAALRAALGVDSESVFADTRIQLRAAVNQLFAAGRDAGVIRDDVQPIDVLHTVVGVCSAGNDVPDAEATRRMLRIVLDGLRYGAPT